MKWCEVGVLVRYILFGEFIQRTNWFVFEIIFFYFLFWILYRFLSFKIANVLLGIITAELIGLAFFLKIGNFWYASSMCALLGILYAQREKDWDSFLCQRYWIKNLFLMLGCAVSVFLFLALGNESVVGNPIAKNMSAIFFCVWIVLLLQKVRVEFRILRWMGKISYEIFLLHLVWIQVLRMFITPVGLYILAVIMVTFISAYVLQILIGKIELSIRKKV